MPIRKIFALAQTHASMKAVVNTTPKAISNQGGPGGIAMRSSIIMGVAGGKREINRANRLEGDCRTGIQVNIGIMINIIAGNIMFWASLISVQAAPMAEKIEPYIIKASN